MYNLCFSYVGFHLVKIGFGGTGSIFTVLNFKDRLCGLLVCRYGSRGPVGPGYILASGDLVGPSYILALGDGGLVGPGYILALGDGGPGSKSMDLEILCNYPMGDPELWV